MTVSVFAGLGSAALFSRSTQSTALVDAAYPEAQVLLRACHTILLTEIRSSGREGAAEVGIDLGDFQHPEDLLKPPEKYHKNAATQNVTLCLVQSLRYIACSRESARASAGEALRDFCRHALPGNCKVRPTNIFAPYHGAKSLSPVKKSLFQDCARRGVDFPSWDDMKVPLYYGKDANFGELAPQQSLLEFILDLILIHPVDWAAAQDRIIADMTRAKGATGRSGDILNFGPGYETNSKCKKDSAPDDIAIVGMAVDLPGAADADGLWHVLANGLNTVSEIPDSRFHVEDFQDHGQQPIQNPKRSMKTKFGNFIGDPFQFDASFFSVSPREAKSIDPQQRILLQTAYKALENAGYVPDASPSYSRETFGCYIGNATLDYPANLKDEIDVYYSPGTLRAFMSGRISYTFGFSGPSMTTDTACSSSLVAIYQACRALASGDCRAAVAGGVNIITSPDMYIGLDRAHFLSPSGQCKAFDATADGYCRSEGCGVFVLKKLSDALAECDSILGVIKGVEVNQSGEAKSITHPDAPTQERLFNRLFDKAGIDPLQVSVVEAHGTGTQAGDPQESASIRSVLSRGRSQRNPLYMTSVKANIGHCAAASGAAGLAKLLLMMQNQTIPGQTSLNTLNPRIAPLGADGIYIARKAIEWSCEGMPRIAMLNNFGAAGSNGALLLQEHNAIDYPSSQGSVNRKCYMFGCSAKTKAALVSYQRSVVSHLRENVDSLSLRDVCYTSTARRQIYQHRISICADSVLGLAKGIQDASPVDVGKHTVDARPTIVFLFSGQGSQYMAMGRELLQTSPTFRDTVLDCDRMLTEAEFPSCLKVIDAAEEDPDQATQVQAYQSSIFVLEVALARIWMEWGVTPGVMAGHSLGQYAALVTAGVIELPDALKIVATRARLMVEHGLLNATGMLAVNLGAARVRSHMDGDAKYNSLSIACNNSPNDCVVEGPLSLLKALKDDLKEVKGKSTLLNTPIAYHTAAMEPVVLPLKELGRTVKWSPPKIPVACNVLGRVVQAGEQAYGPDFPALHCRQSVLFNQSVQDLVGNPMMRAKHIWLEIGPHPSILPMVKSHSHPESCSYIASMRKAVDPWRTLSEALGCLYTSNVPVDWRQSFDCFSRCRCTSLPSYQFDSTEYRVDYPRESTAAIDLHPKESPSTKYAFLGRQLSTAPDEGSQGLEFDTSIENLADFILGHMVCGYALCPASVYHEMALAAAKLLNKRDIDSKRPPQNSALVNVTYLHPLIYYSKSTLTVRTNIERVDGVTKRFTISSFRSSDQSATIHCQGNLKSVPEAKPSRELLRLRAEVDQKKSRFMQAIAGISSEVFHTTAIYDKLFPRVVTYSGMYQAIKSICISDDRCEAVASVQIPFHPHTAASTFAVNPIFMDILLHTAGFVANLAIANGDACVCKEVGSAIIFDEKFDMQKSFQVYCSKVDVTEENAVIADAYAISTDKKLLAAFRGMNFACVKLTKIEAHFRFAATHQSEPIGQPTMKPEVDVHKRATVRQSPGLADIKPLPPALTANTNQSNNVKALVAEVCGIEAEDVWSEKELETLGVDSLMIFELESRLQNVSAGVFTSKDLSTCVTVADVERLVAVNASNLNVDGGDRGLPQTRVDDNDQQQNLSVYLIIAEACGMDANSMTENTQLGAVGIDSLMRLELEERLSVAFNMALDPNALTSCDTIGDVNRLIKSRPAAGQANIAFRPPTALSRQSSSDGWSSAGLGNSETTTLSTPSTSASYENLASLSKPSQSESFLYLVHPGKLGNDLDPLVLIHDGSGIGLKYHCIQPTTCALWAISNPKLGREDGWSSLDAMASAYADAIAAKIKRSCIIGGWSFGGVVAYEVSRILLSRNLRVRGLLLVDSPPPLNHQPLPIEVIDAVTKPSSRYEPQSKIRDAVREQFITNTAHLADFKPKRLNGRYPDTVLLRSKEGFDASGLGSRPHRWLEDRSETRYAVEGWEEIIGHDVKLIDIPGNHFEVFDENNISTTSIAIEKACAIVR
ncbi:MAG: hypothetical protein Q9214_001839 [Letrouitia sp. 1 TL-2023]